jgi:hypothetical protein
VRGRFVTIALLTLSPVCLHAQGRGQVPGSTAVSGRAATPYDITGYWVALITDDWRYRMLTPPKGNVDYLPVNAEGRRVAEMWDPEKDESSGEQCKAYGAAGVMRLPGRLHIARPTNSRNSRMHPDGTQPRAQSDSRLSSGEKAFVGAGFPEKKCRYAARAG